MDEQDVVVEELLCEQDSNEGAFEAASLHNFPVHWQARRLSDLGEVYGGSTPSTKVSEYWDGDLPWLTPSEVTKCEGIYISDTERHITSAGLANCAARLLPTGTVMMTSRASIGEAVINTVPMATNQGFINLVCGGEQAHNEFLVYWIKQHKDIFESRAHGVTFKELNRANFKSIPVALPPLPEQRAIAHTLHTTQEAIQSRRREVDLERERKAALMQHLFTHGIRGESTKQTEIGEMPESWRVVRLGGVFEMQLGKMLSPKAKTGISSKPYMRNANVQWGSVDCSDVLEMDFTEQEMAKFRLKYGDVLVCEGGEVGRTAMWRDELKECYFQKALHRLRPLGNQMLPMFFLHHMERAFRFANIYGIAGTETTIAHLPQEKLAAMVIPMPSLQEQGTITQTLDACDTQITALEQEITLMEELFRALLEELMTGRLSTMHQFAVPLPRQ